MRTTVRRTATLAAALAGGALLVPLAAAPAQAAVTGYTATVTWIGGGDFVNERSAPSLSAQVVRRVSPGTGLAIDCQDTGDRLGFSRYADNRTWDRLTDGTWVHDVLTSTPGGPRTAADGGGYTAWSAGILRCPQHTAAPAPAPAPAPTRESRAAEWARAQIGQVSTDVTTDHMWSGWCETFVEQAYGSRYKYPSARLDYWAQRNAGLVHTDTNPPAGALVFYSWGSYGHVGVSLGGGQVVSTQGYATPQPVRVHAVTGIGLQYLGWAPAPEGWGSR